MFRRIIVSLLALVAVVVAGIAVFVAGRQNLKHDAPYPEIAAATDSATLERGRYLVRNAAPCGACHGDPAQVEAMMAGAEVPLSGGYRWPIPPGTIYARNITPDAATGIGNIPDSAIARALRHGVGHDGRALLPFMEMQGLADDDLAAVISYLRAQPAVHNPVPPHDYSLLGKILRATVLANPVGPSEPPPAAAPRGLSVERGRYLSESVALCWACHTQRDEATGAMTGPRYGGATGFLEPSDPGHVWAPPNLTSDPSTGRLASMSEDEFVARFRLGRVLPGSPMPWQNYRGLTDEDLRSIFRFLKTVPPATRDVGPPVTDARR